MKIVCTIGVYIILFSFAGRTESFGRQVESKIKSDILAKISTLESDTVLYHWDIDTSKIYSDTIFQSTNYNFTMYSLNDSSVYNRVITDAKRKNKNLVEYDVSHNYKIDFEIESINGDKVILSIIKETFKDSLPTEFLKIASIRNNQVISYSNENLIFKTTLSQPNTDCQMAVRYSLSKTSELKILEVIDESYNGSEE